MSQVKGLSRLELAALICEYLSEQGIDVVLSGGSCVSIYSDELYVSKDLDFVDISLKTNRQIAKCIQRLGFENQPKNSRHFAHPDTELTVEFPSAPLTVGDQQVLSKDVSKIEVQNNLLKLLSPTDCIKDRLANYYYFKDNQCLEQALLVAKKQLIDLQELERWHQTEGLEAEFQRFKQQLENR